MPLPSFYKRDRGLLGDLRLSESLAKSSGSVWTSAGKSGLDAMAALGDVVVESCTCKALGRVPRRPGGGRAFAEGRPRVVKDFNNRDFEPALLRLAELLVPVAQSTEAAFSCATAVASALALAAQSCDQLQRPVLAARFRQLSAIFGSYDYQMKGEDYINDSPWPINWKQNMEGILRSMAFLKQHEVQAEPWRSAAARSAVPRGTGKRRVAIVTVCDYDPTQTPLARLSKLNRDAYAKMHGYDVVMYEKAPLFADPLAGLLTEPLAHRPPAWSKVDAVLETLAQGRHDWVMWLDCDSFFMDPEVRLEEIIGLAESRCPATSGDDAARLRDLVAKWQTGPEQEPESLLDWYDNLLESYAAEGVGCDAFEPPTTTPSNRTLGWAEWLFQETRPQLVASEDGLMLNTGVMRSTEIADISLNGGMLCCNSL
ncbi:ANK1 [Symbiodinium necroappetens]|uniref:ANK1 protein n=1 Tax=Symbiodinium necroappetens TaxID=1628268 RepID=A0A812JUS7_9DINO|nr:ANK1 [Symbiodinium necroappetens]